MNTFKKIAVSIAASISLLGIFVSPGVAGASTPTATCSMEAPSRRSDGSWDVLFKTSEKSYKGRPFNFTIFTEDRWGNKYSRSYRDVPKSYHTEKLKGNKSYLVSGYYRSLNGNLIGCQPWFKK